MGKERKYKVKDIISNVLFLALLGLMIFVALRYNVRCVETGSMEPGIHVGALCFVDPQAYDDAEPQVGDIAMYQTETRYVIHRIVREDDDGYVFKGDNNSSEDFSAVPRERISGKVVFTLNLVAPLMRVIRHLE